MSFAAAVPLVIALYAVATAACVRAFRAERAGVPGRGPRMAVAAALPIAMFGSLYALAAAYGTYPTPAVATAGYVGAVCAGFACAALAYVWVNHPRRAATT